MEVLKTKEPNPTSLEFLQSNKELLKKHGITKSAEAVQKEMKMMLPQIINAITYLQSASSDVDKSLKAIIGQGELNISSIAPLKTRHQELYQNIKSLIASKPIADFYIATNFSRPIVKKIAGNINNTETLLKAVIDLKAQASIDLIINEMDKNKKYSDLAFILRNSDIITRHIVVKTILPNMVAGVFTTKEAGKLIDSLKKISGRKDNHNDFFRVLEEFSYLLFFFGNTNGIFIDQFLRCSE